MGMLDVSIKKVTVELDPAIPCGPIDPVTPVDPVDPV
jgi:hypothetical protein